MREKNTDEFSDFTDYMGLHREPKQKKPKKERKRITKKARTIIGVVCGIALAAAIILPNSLVIVPTGYTGVRTTYGQVDPKPASAGLNWTIPFVQDIALVNNKQQDLTLTNQIWAESNERTALYFEGITVSYTISGDKSTWIYSNVSNYIDNLISEGLVSSALKTAAKEFDSTDVTNRGLIEAKTQEALQKSIDEKCGEGVVRINKVVVSNIDFEDSYQQAIANKQGAQIAYEQQQIENKRSVEKAQADAEVTKTTAQADAQVALIRAEAEAEANRTIADSLTEGVLKNRFYDEWDGRLPYVSRAAGSLVEVPIPEMATGETGDTSAQP